MSIPYEGATSGTAAREEVAKILRRMGCSSVGYVEHYDRAVLEVGFVHRGAQYRLEASAKGWSDWWLRENPWTSNRRSSAAEWQAKALRQGMISVNSVLRDWVKAMVTAIECGLATPEQIFLASRVTDDGRTVMQRAGELLALPAPEDRP